MFLETNILFEPETGRFAFIDIGVNANPSSFLIVTKGILTVLAWAIKRLLSH